MSAEVLAALVAAVAAITGSVLTLWANHKAENTKKSAAETTADLERLKLQMNAWPQLLDQYRNEIHRLEESNGRLREDLERAYEELNMLRKEGGSQ